MSRTRFRVNPHSRNSLREIWSLSDCNWTQTHNHLVHKRTLIHLAKLAKSLSCVMSTYLSKELLDIQATTECGFTLKRILDTIRTHNQMHCTDKYWQHSSIIWSVWLNGWVLVYELIGCGFESSCSSFFCFTKCKYEAYLLS